MACVLNAAQYPLLNYGCEMSMRLFHITPTFRLSDKVKACELIRLTIPEMEIELSKCADLVTRTPYANKSLAIAGRRGPRRAQIGMAFAAPRTLLEFTVICTWALDAQRIATHRVTYYLVDTDLDAATDRMALWGRSPGIGTDWPNRWPQESMSWEPMTCQPRMDAHSSQYGGSPRGNPVTDCLDSSGAIIERIERFPLPTVEKERILEKTRVTERFPSLAHAFISPTLET